MKRIDERDVMFSRATYTEGTPQYEDYYKRNPDKKDQDDLIRSKPNLCSPGTMSYDPINSPMADAPFMFLNDIRKLSEGMPNPNKVEVSPEIITKRIKGYAEFYGANLVGITKMKDYHYYSHRGRHPENYGDEVTPKDMHTYGIVFAVEMDKDMINRAPMVSEVITTSKVYVDVAIIGMVLSYYIRNLGYEARNHMDANYLVVCPLVAKDAGLGEIGRNGILTTQKYGSRVRLGVVTTNLPLIEDEPIDFGLSDFCDICNNCARTCPGKAIPKDEKPIVDGIERWQITQESCYDRWRSLGTDCGICISSCPFSQNLDFMEGIEDFTGKHDLIYSILEQYKKKFITRPYIKDAPEWLK